MHIDLSKFKNIIFDLGGVILDIDPNLAKQAFAKLGMIQCNECYEELKCIELFKNHEKGVITNEQFREGLRPHLYKEISDIDIDNAWNSMIIDIPLSRVKILEKLKSTHRTFLLSNTNDIHCQYFNEMLMKKTNGLNLSYFFEKTYYSHLLKTRKPDEAIYKIVLNENQLIPAETLFIDDYAPNIEAARKLGIQTFEMKKELDFCTIF